MSGLSTVAHSVENLYGFLDLGNGDSGSGVGRSWSKALVSIGVGAMRMSVWMQGYGGTAWIVLIGKKWNEK